MRPPWSELLALSTQTLRDLIRMDTSNPPGNETQAALYLQELLLGEGIPALIYEPAPGRGSLIARLAATGGQPRRAEGRSSEGEGSPVGPLVLVANLDTVPATPEGWTHHPFSGTVADGVVWGRGALDAKGPVAVCVALLIAIKRTGLRLARDMVVAAVADGEGDGSQGLGWLTTRHPEEFTGATALVPGGGWPLRLLGQTYYTYVCAEKGNAVLRLVAQGTASHGALQAPDNPLLLLARALAATEGAEPPVHLTPVFQAFVEALAETQRHPAASHIRSLLSPLLTGAAVNRVVAEPWERSLLLSSARNTFTPTGLRGGTRPDMVPREAEAVIDCRVLPGQTAAMASNELAAILSQNGLPVGARPGAYGLRIQAQQLTEPSESLPGGQMPRIFERALLRRRQTVQLVPAMSVGSTLARFLRPLGARTYGFFPMLPDVDITTIHGVDERISVRSLGFSLKVMWEVVTGFAGAAGPRS